MAGKKDTKETKETKKRWVPSFFQKKEKTEEEKKKDRMESGLPSFYDPSGSGSPWGDEAEEAYTKWETTMKEQGKDSEEAKNLEKNIYDIMGVGSDDDKYKTMNNRIQTAKDFAYPEEARKETAKGIIEAPVKVGLFMPKLVSGAENKILKGASTVAGVLGAEGAKEKLDKAVDVTGKVNEKVKSIEEAVTPEAKKTEDYEPVKKEDQTKGEGTTTTATETGTAPKYEIEKSILHQTGTDKNVKKAIKEEKELQKDLTEKDIESQSDINALFKKYVDEEVGDNYKNRMSNFIWSNYRDGEFGEPGTKEAKERLAYAVLDTISTSLRNAANVINKSGERETPEWKEIQKKNLSESLDRYNVKQEKAQETMISNMEKIIGANTEGQNALRAIMADADLKRVMAKQDQSIQESIANLLIEFGKTHNAEDILNGFKAGMLQYATSQGGGAAATGTLSSGASAVAGTVMKLLTGI